MRVPRTTPTPQRGPNAGAGASPLDQLLTLAVANMLSKSQNSKEEEERRAQERHQSQMLNMMMMDMFQQQMSDRKAQRRNRSRGRRGNANAAYLDDSNDESE